MEEVDQAAWDFAEAAPNALRQEYPNLPRMPIEILACPLGKAVNHGGILRIAEAFMLEKVTFSRELDQATDFAGNQGSVRWQPWAWQSIEEAVAERTNRQLVALSLTPQAVPFREFDFKFPVSLVVGSESDGVPESILSCCDAAVMIPMYGLMGSLNVATATAIVIEHIANLYAENVGFQPIRNQKAL